MKAYHNIFKKLEIISKVKNANITSESIVIERVLNQEAKIKSSIQELQSIQKKLNNSPLGKETQTRPTLFKSLLSTYFSSGYFVVNLIQFFFQSIQACSGGYQFLPAQILKIKIFLNFCSTRAAVPRLSKDKRVFRKLKILIKSRLQKIILDDSNFKTRSKGDRKNS